MNNLNQNNFKSLIFIKNDNYILRDHRVHGVRIMPGVTFIDFIYEIIVEKGFHIEEIEIKDILFKQPIATSNSFDKKLELTFEYRSNFWSVIGKSQKISDEKIISDTWDENFECKVYINKEQEGKTLNIEDLKKSAKEQYDFDEAYAFARDVDINHYEFMKALGQIYKGDKYILVEMHLSSLANEYLENSLLHPAYLDASTIASIWGSRLCGISKDQTAIPMFIESFRAFNSLEESCYVYIDETTFYSSANNDIIFSNMELYGQKGCLLARFKKLGFKSIRFKGLITDLETISSNTDSMNNSEQNLDNPNNTDEFKNSTSQELGYGQDEDLKQIIKNYLEKLIADTLNIKLEQLDSSVGFYDQGLNSSDLLKIVQILENKLETKLYPTLLFEYININELSTYLFDNYREKFTISIYAENKNATRTIKDIAIIGLSGRYPMSKDLGEFWENISNGRDCIIEVPKDRWDHSKYYDSNKNNTKKTYSKWGGFIHGVDEFDPMFFNISPREAELMDPQERLFLETTWHTIEDAGYTKKELWERKVGVFVGVMYGHYQLFAAEELLKGNEIAPWGIYASIANRVSYSLNLSGPSMAVDSMCSSSLTAIHLACDSIRKEECELALAGGVNISVHPSKYIFLSQLRFMSSDGKCRSFGEGGDGYVPGEGVGAVLLKPLDKAIEDNDNIYAIIKGSALNHGGKTTGYTVPSPNAQAEVILKALKQSGVNPRTISYIEAHGTGTSLGDPIEIAGLMKAFEVFTKDKQYCSIGSVKSNIGHLESAAGIASISKVLLQMRNKKLVPSIHSDKLNPNISFKDSAFYVQHKLEDWINPVLIENGIKKRIPKDSGNKLFRGWRIKCTYRIGRIRK